jgi:acyl-CoA thioester hydrolase
MSRRKNRGRGLREPGWPDHHALRSEVTLRVPFQDADPTGMAWHGNYFRYYDAARTALLDRLDFTYATMAAAGQMWPVVDTRVRYRRSAQFGEMLRVSAQMVEWEFRMRIYYEIYNATDELINEAYTLQVPIDTATQTLIIGTPAWIVERIERLIEQP